MAFGKAGRSSSATDPAPLSMLETWVELKPQGEWRKGMTPQKLIAEMDKAVRLPGMRNVWGYPIKIRIDMLTTGIRTPVGIKIAGPDLGGIDKLAKQVEELARAVPGTRSAVADRVQGGKLKSKREIHIASAWRRARRAGTRLDRSTTPPGSAATHPRWP